MCMKTLPITKRINTSLNNYFQTKYYDDVNKALTILQKGFTHLHCNEDTFYEIRDYLTLYVI